MQAEHYNRRNAAQAIESFKMLRCRHRAALVFPVCAWPRRRCGSLFRSRILPNYREKSSFPTCLKG